MKHLKFTYVDSVTGISIAAEPAANGPKFPPVAGLQFVWARESAYPTAIPEFFGTCPDGSDTQIDGVLGIFVQADWEQMQADEMERRPGSKTNATKQIQADLAALDLKSIRALREYIAAKPNAPAFIKQHETDAGELRKKLK